jgi:hypothetical protein
MRRESSSKINCVIQNSAVLQHSKSISTYKVNYRISTDTHFWQLWYWDNITKIFVSTMTLSTMQYLQRKPCRYRNYLGLITPYQSIQGIKNNPSKRLITINFKYKKIKNLCMSKITSSQENSPFFLLGLALPDPAKTTQRLSMIKWWIKQGFFTMFQLFLPSRNNQQSTTLRGIWAQFFSKSPQVFQGELTPCVKFMRAASTMAGLQCSTLKKNMWRKGPIQHVRWL